MHINIFHLNNLHTCSPLLLHVVVTSEVTWMIGPCNGTVQTFYCNHTHGLQSEVIWNGSTLFIDANTTGFSMFRYPNKTKVEIDITVFGGRTLLCKINGNTPSTRESEPLHLSEHRIHTSTRPASL